MSMLSYKKHKPLKEERNYLRDPEGETEVSFFQSLFEIEWIHIRLKAKQKYGRKSRKEERKDVICWRLFCVVCIHFVCTLRLKYNETFGFVCRHTNFCPF